MFESLLSIGSLLAVSFGALFSFKIGMVNIHANRSKRNNSPDVYGNHNVIIYNEAIKTVQKEMAFSVKLCIFAMLIFFHKYPSFFIGFLSSLIIWLPLFCASGVVLSIKTHGIKRLGDVMYIISSVVMGVFCYCSSRLLSLHVDIYPEVTGFFRNIAESIGYYGLFYGVAHASNEIGLMFNVIYASAACAALISLGGALCFSYITERDANKAFSRSIGILFAGYIAYVFSSGVLFSSAYHSLSYFIDVLMYPFSIIYSYFSF
ncbi:hypothetical protein [Klebsiella variicola]|uniref:hypothetical protein n=1 Tax=Klebsiella variicola TaxID=244366 RepID=UPI002B05F415|nr:hypothetical protein [Klebsiella variicola]